MSLPSLHLADLCATSTSERLPPALTSTHSYTSDFESSSQVFSSDIDPERPAKTHNHGRIQNQNKLRKKKSKGIGSLIRASAMASEPSTAATTASHSFTQSQSFSSSRPSTQTLSAIDPALLDIIPPLHAILAPLALDTLDAKQLQIDSTQVQLNIERIRGVIKRLPAAEKSVDELREEVRAAEERVEMQKAVLRSLGKK